MALSDSSKFLKVFLTLVAAYLFLLGTSNFYRFVTSTTDENLFRNPPSDFYIIKGFPALRVGHDRSASKTQGMSPDSIRVGNMLVAINDKKVETESDVESTLHSNNASKLTLEIFRTAEDKLHTYEVNAHTIPDSFYRRLPETVYVQEVIPGGASDIAGLKKGDLIFQINQETFLDVNEADKILRDAEIGTTISYDIFRKNKTLRLQVTLVSWGVQISLLIALISGLIFWSVGVFVALNQPKTKAARLLGLSLMCFGFLVMASFLNRGDPSVPLDKLRVMTAIVCMPLGLVFWIHSSYYFPQKRPEILEQRWLTRIPYLIAVLFFLVILLLALAIHTKSLLGEFILLGLLLGLMLYHFGVNVIFRKQRPKEYTKVRRPLTYTTILAIAVTFILGFLLVRMGKARQLGYVALPLIAIPFAYLYLIGRYQLLDINLRIRRHIQYIVVSSIWIAVMVILFIKILVALPNLSIQIPNLRFTGTSIVVMDEPPDPELHTFLEKLTLISLSIALAFTFLKIGKSGQRVIAGKFNRNQYNISQATSELSEIMATRLGMRELAQGIIERLAKLMHLKRVGVLFFRNQTTCCCHEAYGFGDDQVWQSFYAKSGEILINEIRKFRSESRFSIEYLPLGMKEEFVANGFRHIIPIRFKDKLVGTFIIGEKLSETPLNLEDLAFLAAVAKQASIAIENAFLHEELTEQERLKHELAIARRIQMASLPQVTPKIEGLDVAGASIPALEVGGDYFDYLDGLSCGVTIIVGDVSGKGTSAALYMSKVQGILRSLHQFNLTPRELFIRANQLLCKDLEKRSFVTAIGAYFDPQQRQLFLARAGHLPLFHYQAQYKKVELIAPKGLGLGLDEDEIFVTELEEKIIPYGANDVFLFVTDGITEAKTGNGGEFGEERLAASLLKHVSRNANKIRDQVLAEVKNFVGETLPHDDQTIVVVKTL